MIFEEDVVALDEWVARAKDDEERKRREAAAKVALFPEHLSAEEVARREDTAKRARARRKPQREDDPMPQFAVPQAPPMRPLEWDGLISKTSPAYRASLHDGTGAEVEFDRAEARGSPFEVDLPQGKR